MHKHSYFFPPVSQSDHSGHTALKLDQNPENSYDAVHSPHQNTARENANHFPQARQTTSLYQRQNIEPPKPPARHHPPSAVAYPNGHSDSNTTARYGAASVGRSSTCCRE